MIESSGIIKVKSNPDDISRYKLYLQYPTRCDKYAGLAGFYWEIEADRFKERLVILFSCFVIPLAWEMYRLDNSKVTNQCYLEPYPIKVIKNLSVLVAVSLGFTLFKEVYLREKYGNSQIGARRIHRTAYEILFTKTPEMFSSFFQDRTLIFFDGKDELQIKLSKMLNFDKDVIGYIGVALKLIATHDQLLRQLIIGMHDKGSTLSRLDQNIISRIFKFCKDDLVHQVKSVPFRYVDVLMGEEQPRLNLINLVKEKESKLEQEIVAFSNIYSFLTNKKTCAFKQKKDDELDFISEDYSFDIEAQAFLPLQSKSKLKTSFSNILTKRKPLVFEQEIEGKVAFVSKDSYFDIEAQTYLPSLNLKSKLKTS